jgi:sporulation protein YlmC with PRC-barrel domain
MTTGKVPDASGTAAAPMLRRTKDLQTYTIRARDGDVGTLHDFHFDDQSWTVRYLVVDTGRWLSGRRVLIPPRAIEAIDSADQRLRARLTMRQIEDSPGVDTDKPVSRQHEIDVLRYYGFPYYWGGPYRWGPITSPAAALPPSYDAMAGRQSTEPAADPHLRSVRDVSGYGIQATDGELGHVEEFLVDEDAWAIRYLLVDPRSWWPGKHVLVPTEWITAVHWADRTVEVNVDKQAVRGAPAFDPAGSLDRTYETHYYGYFGRPGYWERPPEAWTLHRPAA